MEEREIREMFSVSRIFMTFALLYVVEITICLPNTVLESLFHTLTDA